MVSYRIGELWEKVDEDKKRVMVHLDFDVHWLTSADVSFHINFACCEYLCALCG